MLELLADTVGLGFLFDSNKTFLPKARTPRRTQGGLRVQTKKPPLKVARKNKHNGLHKRHIPSVLSYDAVEFLGESDCPFVSTVSIKCGKLGYDFDNQPHQRLL